MTPGRRGPARRRARAAAPGRRQLGTGEPTVTPLYHQMYLVLRERIRGGELDPAQPLPGEHHLAAQFGVSRVTVRRTLQQLERDGLIDRRRGIGTFPRARPPAMEDRYNVGGLTDAGITPGTGARITTLAADMVEAPARVAALFGLQGGLVLRVLRQRAVGAGEPFTVLTTWVPPALAGRLSRRQLRTQQTLVALEESGVQIARAEQTVTAQLADGEAAALLRVPVGAPLLAMATFFADRQDAPVALFEALYRPDRFQYRLAMRRRGDGRQRRWDLVE